MTDEHRGSRPVSFSDYRLVWAFLWSPARFATVSEYSKGTGIPADQVMEELAKAADAGAVRLESYRGEVFVHTSPDRRTANGEGPLPPNMWELLRREADIDEAYEIWMTARRLEEAGWRVEVNPSQVRFAVGVTSRNPLIGVYLAYTLVPVARHRSDDELEFSLTDLWLAGAPAVAVTCHQGGLDSHVTLARKWLLSNGGRPSMSILVLEAPSYVPVLVSYRDGAVRPVTISRDTPLPWHG